MTLHLEADREGGAMHVADAKRLLVLRNCLAELLVIGLHLKDAELFGSYDVLRSAISTISRQYTELEDELG